MLRHVTVHCDNKNHIFCTPDGYLDVPSYMAGVSSGFAFAALIVVAWCLVVALKRRSALKP